MHTLFFAFPGFASQILPRNGSFPNESALEEFLKHFGRALRWVGGRARCFVGKYVAPGSAQLGRSRFGYASGSEGYRDLRN